MEREEDDDEVGRLEVSAPEEVRSWKDLEISTGAVTMVAGISEALAERGV